jgi:hypothetical protein
MVHDYLDENIMETNTRVASRHDMQAVMSCWPDTSGCVEHMYNRHTKREEHMNVSAIHLMCRFITLCVADPIWGVCCDSYTLIMDMGIKNKCSGGSKVQLHRKEGHRSKYDEGGGDLNVR